MYRKVKIYCSETVNNITLVCIGLLFFNNKITLRNKKFLDDYMIYIA